MSSFGTGTQGEPFASASFFSREQGDYRRGALKSGLEASEGLGRASPVAKLNLTTIYRAMLAGWACYWPLGWLCSWPLWWVGLGLAYFLGTGEWTYRDGRATRDSHRGICQNAWELH